MTYHGITPDQVRALLESHPPHTGKLATVHPDGRPHVAPVWFVAEPDGSVLSATMKDSVKGRNLRHPGRAALCVDVEDPPCAFVLIEGHIELTDDLDQLRTAAVRIGARYMGAKHAEEIAARNGVPGGLLVRVHPEGSPVPQTWLHRQITIKCRVHPKIRAYSYREADSPPGGPRS